MRVNVFAVSLLLVVRALVSAWALALGFPMVRARGAGRIIGSGVMVPLSSVLSEVSSWE